MNKKLPKISIVMPSFNTVDYIERSIKSVVTQNYPYFELFIKDGGSKDGSVEIIKYYAKKYPKKVRYISSKDKGQTDAINYGMKRVNGDVLTYLNSDDVYKPGALGIIGEYFKNNPAIMWVYGKCDIIDGSDKEIRKWVTSYKNFWLRNYSYITLLILNYISQMACFWRKEAAEKVGEFDADQHYVMDYDYWLRLGKHYRAGVIPEYLASFRIVETTKSSTGFLKQFKDEYYVATRYAKNSIILALHKLNYVAIISIYTLMRYLRTIKKLASPNYGN